MFLLTRQVNLQLEAYFLDDIICESFSVMAKSRHQNSFLNWG